jgi:hypothetical protein
MGSATQYLAGDGHDDAPGDPLEFLARALAHFPDPVRHLARYHGAYSNVGAGQAEGPCRAGAGAHRDAGRPRSAAAGGPGPSMGQPHRRICEVDPLPARAGSLMRVVSFITQPGLIRRILYQPRKTPRFASVKFRSVSFRWPRRNRS